MDRFDVAAIVGVLAFAGGLWLLPPWAAGLALVVVGFVAFVAGVFGALLAGDAEES